MIGSPLHKPLSHPHFKDVCFTSVALLLTDASGTFTAATESCDICCDDTLCNEGCPELEEKNTALSELLSSLSFVEP